MIFRKIFYILLIDRNYIGFDCVMSGSRWITTTNGNRVLINADGDTVASPNNTDGSVMVQREDIDELGDEFTPKSDILKRLFPDGIPVSPNVTRINFELGKQEPAPLIEETDYLESLKQSFLTEDGYFLNGGQVTSDGYRITHATVLGYLTGSTFGDLNTNETATLARDLHLVRVADAYGDVVIHVPGKLSTTQFKKIKQLVNDAEDEDKDVSFDLGVDDLRTRFSSDNKKEFYAEIQKRGYYP